MENLPARPARLSRQLSVQTGGDADQLIARSIGRALSAAVDAAALTGLGDGVQPRGILYTPGVNDLPIGGGDWWPHLCALRRVCLDDDAEPETYSLIFSPGAEQYFDETPAFVNGSSSILASLAWPHQVSNQIRDGRVFAGCFAYEVLLFWGAGVDLVVDNFTRPGQILITSSVYADTVCRFGSAFAFTQPDSIVTPPPLARRRQAEITVASQERPMSAPAAAITAEDAPRAAAKQKGSFR